jgi:PTH1 family peptidyl-tRNA hydrolase
MQDIKMIVGLGNPGPQYSRNRHNIGFQCVELFAQRHGLRLDKMQQRAMTGSGFAIAGGTRYKVLLAKPLTYMNGSGEAVAPLARYYQVEPQDMIVVHDDLDLASAKLRLRYNGSSGGQNGIKSIMDRLGTAEFARIKVGIGRPPGRMDPADYVLQNFSAAEEELFGPLRARVCDALECWLHEGIDAAMNRYNG